MNESKSDVVKVSLGVKDPSIVDPLGEVIGECEKNGTEWRGSGGPENSHWFQLGPDETLDSVRARFEGKFPELTIEITTV